MKRILLTLLLMVPGLAGAQSLVNCAPATPCTLSGPVATGTGDPAYISFGKINANTNLLAAAFTMKFPGGDTTSLSMGTGAYSQTVATNGWNIAIGFLAMGSSTACIGGSGMGFDTAIGWESLNVDAGCENTGVGVNTLKANTSGSFNVAIGNDAMGLSTTAISNVAIGHSACGGGGSDAAYTGSSSMCIGASAGGFMSGPASFNAFIGALAGQGTLANQNTGVENTAIGWSALANVSSGAVNTCIGFNACAGTAASPLTGSNNVAVGGSALAAAQGAGIHNVTAIGWQSLQALTSGNYDTCVGNQSCTSMTGDYFTTVLGASTGDALNGGHANTLIGYGVASSTLATGNDNLIIGTGDSTCDTAAGGTSNTIKVCAGSTGIWSVTGAGTPSTAAESFTGSIAFPNVTTGTNADFVCMAAGEVLTLQSSPCTISSLRFKTNVNPFTGDALAELGRLQVQSFQMKDTDNPDHNASRPQIGLIAENVASVEPKCAIYEDDLKTPKSYRPECITALLVKAAQEHQVVVHKQFVFLYVLLALCGLLMLHNGYLHHRIRQFV